MISIAEYIDDLERAIEKWIDRHDESWFLEMNEDVAYENHYFWWLEENCPHSFGEKCDCNVPELSYKDMVSEVKQMYTAFCLDFGIDDIMEDMTATLADLDNDEPFERLAAFVRGIHLNHVHGSIVDYCFYINHELINSISQTGLEQTFGQEEIDKFAACQ